MSCVEPAEVVRYLEKDLGPERSAAVGEHFKHCERCARLRDEMEALRRRLAADPGEFGDPGLADDLLTLIRLGQADRAAERGRSFWSARWVWAGAAAAVMLIAAVPMWLYSRAEPRPDTEFAARGGPSGDADAWVSIQIFKATPGGYEPAIGQIAPDDALAFAYDKRARSGYGFLMILAVDQRGEIFWYYPAYEDASSDPASIPVDDTLAARPLRDEIQHALRPGALRVFSVFSRQALRVKAVEAMVEADWQRAGSIERLQRLSIPGTGQHTLLLSVGGV
ncbi:MAG: hypothetical protein JXR96_06965 [Deltaproteobacteria bacterium]|nr:hypothetical protein [Deltaproteobacteria bacterium]